MRRLGRGERRVVFADVRLRPVPESEWRTDPAVRWST
jgi:hypothetical protein